MCYCVMFMDKTEYNTWGVDSHVDDGARRTF